MKSLTKLLNPAVVAAAMSVAMVLPAQAKDLNLSGKRVTWIVPFEEGGGSDTLARLFQPYLEKELKATVIVLNQPGGASIKGANKFEASAATDGTVIFGASSATFAAASLEQQSVQFNPLGWEPIIGLPRGAVLYANPDTTHITGYGKDMAGDLKAMKAAEVIVPAKSPTGSELLDLVVLDNLGIKPKVVFGLSTSKARQAFFRGEVSVCQDGTGAYLSKVASGETGTKAIPFVSYGYVDAKGVLQRDPDVPDVPTFLEVYKAGYGKAPSGPGYDALMNLLNLKISLSKVVVLPKGTSKDIVDGYIDVFKKIVQNPDVIQKLKEEVGSLPFTFGDDTRRVIEAGVKMQPSTRDWINEYLKVNHNASL